MRNMLPEEILVEVDKLREKENLVKDEKVKPLSEYEILRLPNIPDNWKWVLINDISTFITNGVHTPTGPEDTNGYGLHCLRITDIQGDSDIDYNQLPYCLRIVSGDYDKKLRKGDIYFSFTGNNLGKRFIVKEDREDTVFAHYFVRWHPLIVNPYYVYYVAHSKVYDQFIQERTLGSTQPNLKVTDLKRFPIPLCDLETQNKIANFLKNIDDKISCNKAINRNLEDQVDAIYKSLFIDFNEYDGVCPDAWESITLGEMAEIASGKRPPMKQNDMSNDASIPLVGAASVMGYTNEVLYDSRILVTGRVGTHGVIQRINEKCWPSDNTLVITTSRYEYVYQILKGIDYRSMNRGSTQPLITQGDLKKVEVIKPTIDVLDEFETLAGGLMNQYENNQIENIKLAELRDTLLPKLMSGELDVSEIVF